MIMKVLINRYLRVPYFLQKLMLEVNICLLCNDTSLATSKQLKVCRDDRHVIGDM